MAWPQDPRDVEVGLLINGAWVDGVTTGNGVRLKEPISISSGRSNWANKVQHGSARFALDNRDGRWSPDNPSGAYAGNYKRNIPVRVGVGSGERYATWLGGADWDVISCPDAAALDITGDFDLRVEFELHENPADVSIEERRMLLARKRAVSSTTGWWLELFYFRGVPGIRFRWYDSSNTLRAYETYDTTGSLPHRILTSRSAVRFTLDVDNGSSDSTARFYWADRIAGPWTEVGDGNGATGVGVTDFDTGTAALFAGGMAGTGTVEPVRGKVFALELRDGIDGAVVADPDLTVQTVGAASFSDAAGNTWTVGSGGRITDRRWRFHGELASLPVRWETEGVDVWSSVEAAGLFRRLRQRNRVESALGRAIVQSATNLVQYWPCEETGDHLERFGAAVGSAPLAVSRATPNSATNTDFLSSAALPEVQGDTWTAVVDSYATSTAWQVRWLLSVPSDFAVDGVVVMRVETSDLDWEIEYRDDSGGQLRVMAYDGSSTVLTGTWTSFDVSGKPMRITFNAQNDGSDVDWVLEAQKEIESSAGGTAGTISSQTAGNVTLLQVNANGLADGWAFGHITLQSAVSVSTELADALAANRGETAAQRVKRMCEEEGLAYHIQGDPAVSEVMGPQQPDTIMGVLEECARTDLGILHEARDALAVRYRTRASMLAQGDRLDDETDLVGWWSSRDILSATQQIIPNRVAGGAAATLGTGDSSDTSDPAITIGDPTRVDPDASNDFIDVPYTPTFTKSTGQLTLIYVGYWDSDDTAANTARMLSSESASQNGLLLHTSGAATAEPKIRVGSSPAAVAQAVPPTSQSLADGELFGCAAVFDDGDLSLYFHGDGLSSPSDMSAIAGSITHGALRLFARGYTNSDNSAGGWLELLVIEGTRTATQLSAILTRLLAGYELGIVDLDHSTGELARPLEPDRDDQGFSNDVTVNNRVGGSARATLSDGSDLSVSEPPTGAGSYPKSFPVNAGAAALDDIAARILGLSTVDEARITRLPLALHNIASDAALTEAVLTMNLGDLVTVNNNLDTWNGGAQISQLAQGVTERIHHKLHFVDLLTSPGSPWRPNDLLVISTKLEVTGVNTTRGTGGPRTVTNPINGAGGSLIAVGVAQGPSEEPTGTWSKPHTSAELIFDYPGDEFVPRVRLWQFTETAAANYTFGWTATTDLQAPLLIGLDGEASSIDVSAEPVVNNKTDADHPPIPTEPDDLVLALDVAQSFAELTGGTLTTAWTEEFDNTNLTPLASAVHSAYAEGTTTQPPNGTWDDGTSAKVRITIRARA